jgi:hypothetical protein
MPREPRSEHLEHASDERPDGRVDGFGASGEATASGASDLPGVSDRSGAAPSPGTASPDGPSRYERIAEFPRRLADRAPRAGGYGEAAAPGAGHVPLFDSPAARADPTPYPNGSRRMPDPGGEPPPAAQAPVPPLPKRSKDGPRVPFGRADDPLFGPLDRDRLLFDDTFHGHPEPPLFGDALAQERRVPGGPPPGDAPARADRAPGEEPPSADGAGGPQPDGGTPRPGRRRRLADTAADLPPSSNPQSSNPQSSMPQSSMPQSSMPQSSVPRTPAPPDPTGPTPPGTAPAEPRLPEPRPDGPRPDGSWSGQPPSPDFEPSRLLGGTERDLLSQLQAELSTPERRPRPYRRAGRPGPTGTVNGHGHSPRPDGERPPPDMAG